MKTKDIYLAKLLHCYDSVTITIKKFEGLLETLDVLPRQLPVGAESLCCVPGHGFSLLLVLLEVRSSDAAPGVSP